jgi:Mn2+/Fe2+ NRAMP family transporter
MFFWQASEEIEEEKMDHLLRRNGLPHIGKEFIKNLRIDNFAGMLFSEIGTWSIIVVTATVLNAHGITNIKTAADAAKALEPLVSTFPNAGYVAKVIFAVGVLGLGFLSIPILAGSAAYAFTEAFNLREGLSQKLKKAHGFYGVITIATLIGLMINFIGINPIQALVFAAVINGIVAVPLILIIGLIAKNKKIMGEYKSGWISNILVWATFIGMGAAVVGMLITFVK